VTYIDQRDAILVHAKAAALAANPTWTNVEIGFPSTLNDKGARVFYGGEIEPVRMGGARVLNGELVSEHVALVAWWAVSNLGIGQAKAIEDEMFTFKHEIRTRVLGDSQLGGKSTDLAMSYAEPDTITVGTARYVLLGFEFTTDYTEYAIAP
jgi:hypothetical protein